MEDGKTELFFSCAFVLSVISMSNFSCLLRQVGGTQATVAVHYLIYPSSLLNRHIFFYPHCTDKTRLMEIKKKPKDKPRGTTGIYLIKGTFTWFSKGICSLEFKPFIIRNKQFTEIWELDIKISLFYLLK